MWRNFLLTVIVFCLSLGILYLTIFSLDPLGEQKNIAYVAFFFSTFSAVWSFFTMFFFFAAEIYTGHKLGTRHFLIASRRALWTALFAITIAGLQIFRLLGPEEFILLLVFFILLEWIFLTGKYQ